jgi:hypothetical protein
MQKKIVYLQYPSPPKQTANSTPNIYLVKNSFRVKREYGWPLTKKKKSEYIGMRLGLMKNVSLLEREC